MPTKYRNAPCPDCLGTGQNVPDDFAGRKQDFGDCPTCGDTGKVPTEEAEAA